LIEIATAAAFFREKAFLIISSCPAKSIPCLNLPALPMTPFNLICETIFFFFKRRTYLSLTEYLIDYKYYLY